MNYRVLVLHPSTKVSLPVLRKVKDLVARGATVLMPRPDSASGMAECQKHDQEANSIAAELLGDAPSGQSVERPFGKGRALSGKTAREVLLEKGVTPDFSFTDDGSSAPVPYIHRKTSDADIYFLASRLDQPRTIQTTFRVSGRAPELWNPP